MILFMSETGGYFVYKKITIEQAKKIFENNIMEVYSLNLDNESEFVITSMKQLEMAGYNDNLAIEVGHLEIELNYH